MSDGRDEHEPYHAVELYLAEELGFGQKGAAEVVRKHPPVLGYSMEGQVTLTVNYLAENLGLGHEGAVKTVRKFPPMLGYSLEGNIKPTVRYLAEELGLGQEGAAEAVRKLPQVLGYSVEGNIKPTLAFIISHFPDSTISNAISLIAFSLIGRMMPRVNILKRHGMMGKWSVGTVMTRTNIKFCETVGIDEDEYDHEVVACKEAHVHVKKN